MQKKYKEIEFINIPNSMLGIARRQGEAITLTKVVPAELRVYWLLQRYRLERFDGVLISIDYLHQNHFKEHFTYNDHKNKSVIDEHLTSLVKQNYIELPTHYSYNTFIEIGLNPIHDYIPINDKLYDVFEDDTQFAVMCMIYKANHKGEDWNEHDVADRLGISTEGLRYSIELMKKQNLIFEKRSHFYPTPILSED